MKVDTCKRLQNHVPIKDLVDCACADEVMQNSKKSNEDNVLVVWTMEIY